MKLFKDKNRGPKIKSEDVVIPEEYLEYEREAEERKKRMEQFRSSLSEQKEETFDDVQAEPLPDETEDPLEDPISIRVENLLNKSKKMLTGELDEAAESPAAAQTPEDEEILVESDEEMAMVEEPPKQKKKERRAKKKNDIKRQPKQPSENNIPTGFVVFLTLVVLVVAAIVVLLGPLMKIDRVQVNDLQYMDETQVLDIAGQPYGQNLFLYRASKAEEALCDYPYVEACQIKRHFPHWLEIQITEREPAGVLLNNGSYLQFSMDGVLLDNTESLTNQNLPLITGFSMDEVPSPGEAFKDNQRFSDALAIVNACPEDLLAMIQEINIRDRNNILAYTSQGLEVRIGNIDNIEARMQTLDDIMNQVILSGIIEEPIEAIDIRYEKSPVVVLEGYDNIDVSGLVDDDSNDAAEDGNNSTQESTNVSNQENENTAQQGAGDQSGTVVNDQIQTDMTGTALNGNQAQTAGYEQSGQTYTGNANDNNTVTNDFQ